MKHKKLISLLVMGAIIGGTLFAGCGSGKEKGSGENISKESHDTFTFGLEASPSTLAPNDTFQDASRYVASNIYDRLWYFHDGEIVYRCATSVENLDETHIQITLRDDVYDTSGNHMTASDVLFCVKHLSETPFASLVQTIDVGNSEIVNDYKLVLALVQPYNLQIRKLAALDLFDEDAFRASEDAMTMHPVGYGPYKLESFVAGTGVVLSLRDDYWDGDAQFKTVNFKVIKEPSQRTNALIAGDIDAFNYVQESDINYINDTNGLSVQEFPYLNVNGILFNCNQASPCSDINVRKAIAYAIDIPSIVSVGYENFAGIAQDMCSVDVSSDADSFRNVSAEFDNYYARDVETAKELLTVAGYAKGFTLNAVHFGGNGGDKSAEMVQKMLSEIGITLKITSYDQATIDSMMRTQMDQWDICFNGWMADSDVSYDLIGLHAINLNNANWEGDAYEETKKLVSQAEQSSDDVEVQELTQKIHRLVTDNLPYMGIADIHGEFALKDGIEVKFWNEGQNHFDLFQMTWK